ncbi:hypothetical protein Aduo_019048 [Ancylostoma duodenale]
MRQNVVTMFGQTPAFAEPCAAMGSAPRMTPIETYPVHLMKEFLVSMQSYVAGQVQQKLFDVYDKPGNTEHDAQGRSQQTPTFRSGFQGRGNRGNGHCRRPSCWVFKPY